jgi:hypothetical protein
MCVLDYDFRVAKMRKMKNYENTAAAFFHFSSFP